MWRRQAVEFTLELGTRITIDVMRIAAISEESGGHKNKRPSAQTIIVLTSGQYYTVEDSYDDVVKRVIEDM